MIWLTVKRIDKKQNAEIKRLWKRIVQNILWKKKPKICPLFMSSVVQYLKDFAVFLPNNVLIKYLIK